MTTTSNPSTSSTSKDKLHAASDRQESLARYFHEMSGGVLLSAEQEVELASQLRSEEENLWQALLSFAPLVAQLTDRINSELGEKKEISVRGLRTAATRDLKKASTKSQDSLERAARKAAILLRERDPDQDVLLGLLASIEGNEFMFEGSSDSYRCYAVSIRALQKKATRTRNRFVESNLGLVVRVAKRYQFSGMSLSDLIQEGNLGLLRAVSRFDDRKGFRFSTYATWWIRHAVGRGVSDKSRTVRVPVHVTETSQKLKRLSQEMSRELGREPSREALSKVAEMSVQKIEATLQAARASSVSLDAPVGEEGERERMEVFSSDEEDSVFERMSTLALSKQATKALATLAPLEVEILHRRFGLEGKNATTLQDIANHIGKSRERIRQIQEKALQKLRTQLVTEHAL
ncbi:MAG: sigma-70 family RNA polymerase sigma factor [Myxococcales bacterium]|nr:sigma-70 family RNA polymerase sigma factor [Myxococcales bacterium]